MQNNYLDALKKRVLVFDGAMGTMIQRYNLTEADYGGKEGCNEYLVLTRPDIVEQIHTQYLEAGCDILETDSFTGSRLKLEEYGLGELTHKINVTAAQIARHVADRFATPERPRWVAGSLGPTGMLPSSNDPALSNITFNQLADIFEEQAIALIEGGVDLLLIETSQDILEVKAAIHGIQRAFEKVGKRVPLQVQVTLDVSGRMLLGTDIAAVMTILEALPVDVIGLNCSTGPEHMREPIRFLCENSRLPISCIPNAGLPHNEGGVAVYPETPQEMIPQLAEFVTEFGVSVVGGCCGTTPDHIRLLVKTVEGLVPKQREVVYQPRIASTIRAVTLQQEPPPLLVGERVNATGSRKVKRLLMNDQYDDIVAVAREQVESGAHALDVSVALTERPDEGYQMSQVVKRLGMSVEAPLVIDSTEADVVKQALELYGGRAIINSVNLENGRKRVDAIFPLAKIHGSAVVALTIDEEGMAKSADRKLEVAKRIHDIAVDEYGLPPDALIFDVQTFPLTTGQADLLDSALQTMEGIRKIKAALPGVFTILGVSNLSFGIDPRARAVLNSVFLYHAVQAGLDLAIINPAHVTPYAEINEEERTLAEDLILNRKLDALAAYIQYWEGRAPDADEKEAAVDPTEGMTPEQKIHWQILHRKKDNIENLIDQALQNQDPVAVLNNVLLPAMKDVGDRFGAGELILPFVLQSAEVMKRAVAHLEQYLEKKEGYTKGRVVIATVFGDVHDIGKNLVNTILTNNGYTVYDLGKQVPVNKIIDKAIEVDATAIGLSALLVSTSKQMPNVVQELEKRGLKYPVIIGGAAINRPYGQRILFVEPDVPYEPGVFYAKDAFEGLEIMDTLTGDPAQRERFVRHTIEVAREAQRKEQERLAAAPAPKPQPARSAVKDAPVPPPPFWGVRVLGPEDIDMREVFNHLPLKDLFFLSWGGSAMKGADRERLLEEDFRPRLSRMQDEVIANGTLIPRAIYGYFPCQSTGDELIVYDPKIYEVTGEKREVTRFSFARQPDGERLCLADYYASVDSGRVDVLELQVVTMGEKASQLADALQKAGDYTEAYFLHGLSVQSAEALADWLHNRARLELGLAPEQGKRYSWGYAACPDTSEHSKLYKLMPVTEATGVELTESFQFVPEQTTAAMVVHHPEAKYYSTISRPFLNVTGDVG